MKKKNVRGTFWTGAILLLGGIFFAFVRVESAEKTYWVIQVASYENAAKANKDLDRLILRQFPNPRIEKMDQSPYPYKLLIGRFSEKANGDQTLKRVQTLFPEAFHRSIAALSFPASPPASAKQPATAPPPKPLPGTPSPAVSPGSFNTPSARVMPAPQKAKKVEPAVGRSDDSEPHPTLNIPEESPVEMSDQVISFEALGYPEATYFAGSSPEFIFYLLNYEGLVKAEAEVLLRLSNVLSEKSTLTVALDDVPQFTKSLKEVGYTPRLSFPVHRTPQNEHVKVSVRGHLFVTEEACEDPAAGATWMVVSNKSRLILSGENPKPERIADFFRNYRRDINVSMNPETVSFNALPLFYYIHSLNDWKKVNVGVTPESANVPNTIQVGRFSQDMAVRDGVLQVNEEKVHLLKKTFQPLYITSALQNAALMDEGLKKGIVRFDDMGIKHFSATGVGDLSLNIPLHYSLFAGIPQNLHLTLVASHTPIPTEDKAFLRIFLNKLLLKAVQLEKGGEPRVYRVDIPEELLEVYNNTLAVVASYFPHQGGCGVGAPRMTLSISKASRFEYGAVERRGINSMVDVLGSLSGKVLLMLDDRKMFMAGVHLMNLLGQFNKTIPNIDVQSWTGKVPEGYDFVLLLLNPENTRDLEAPLRLDKGQFAIVNPVTKNNLFDIGPEKTENSKKERMRVEYQSGFGVLQTFDHRDAKVVLLSYYKEASALAFLKDITPVDIGRFNGNVVLFNQDIVSYQVGDKFRVVYQEARSVPYYLSRFKLPMVLLGVFILLFFMYYVNKKLVRE